MRPASSYQLPAPSTSGWKLAAGAGNWFVIQIGTICVFFPCSGLSSTWLPSRRNHQLKPLDVRLAI